MRSIKNLTYWIFGWIGLVGGILLQFVKGGVTIDHKIEFGQYLFRYRKNPDEWVPVSRWLYSLDVVHGILFVVLGLAFFCFALLEFKSQREDDDGIQ